MNVLMYLHALQTKDNLEYRVAQHLMVEAVLILMEAQREKCIGQLDASGSLSAVKGLPNVSHVLLVANTQDNT